MTSGRLQGKVALITGQTIVVDGGALLPQNGSFMV
jgi:hypothetical protein